MHINFDVLHVSLNVFACVCLHVSLCMFACTQVSVDDFNLNSCVSVQRDRTRQSSPLARRLGGSKSSGGVQDAATSSRGHGPIPDHHFEEIQQGQAGRDAERERGGFLEAL